MDGFHTSQPQKSVPDLDWEAHRSAEFLERAVAVFTDFIERLPANPIARRWRDGEVAARATMKVPSAPLPDDDLFAHVSEVMNELSVYTGHPAFMGYISGPGTVPGAVADLLASVLNQNIGGWRLGPAATEIERHLLAWFAQKFGLGATAGGVFTSGGSLSTLTCLKVARDVGTAGDVRFDGVEGRSLRIYASEESHAVVVRAADVLGVGRNAVRRVPIDKRWRMDVDALQRYIEQDRADGLRPIAVVGTAGTTATGSIDPLEQVADVCDAHGIWMHVDGAYGGGAILAPDLAPHFAGIERANSIAFDPHKWLYTPLPGGCVLFKDIALAFRSFDIPATYTIEDRERTGSTFDFGSHGLEWSRAFSGFRVWLSLLAFGEDAYARRISHDAELARYLGARVEEAPDLELMAPVSLSVCCFRFVPNDDGPMDEQYLSRLNERLMTEIQLDGRAYCSNAVLNGRSVLRACVVNHRTEAEHVDLLIEVVRELGSRLHAEIRPKS